MSHFALRTTVLLIVVSAAAAMGAHAQSPADRAALDALRDTLASVTDPALVEGISRDWSPRRDGQVERLRRGLLSLRIGTLNGRREPLDDALVEFGEAAQRHGDWPYPRYGLALTKLALNDGGWMPKPGRFQAAGESWYHGFTEAIARALEVDPAFAPAESLLVDVLAQQGQREQPRRLIDLLRRGLTAGEAADPRIHLIIGRDFRRRGDHAEALAAFERYLAGGGSAAVGELERARALAVLGRRDAALQAYEAGARAVGGGGTGGARQDSAARYAYREDVAWVADSAELATFEALPRDSIGGWLRGYWAARDAIELREPGDRLAEHLQRWNYVHARYRIPNPDRRTQFERRPSVKIGRTAAECTDGLPVGINDLEFADGTWSDDARRRERLLDDRAIVYMRHGAPARRLGAAGVAYDGGSLTVQSMETPEMREATRPDSEDEPEIIDLEAGPEILDAGRQESWLYWFEGQPRLFHFSGGDAAGRHAATTLSALPPLSEHVLRAAGGVDGRYQRLAFLVQRRGAGGSLARPITCYEAYQDLRRERREDMVLAVETDSHTRFFARSVAPVVQAFAVGDAAQGTGRLLVVFAVPGAPLAPEPRTDGRAGVAYPLTIQAVAYDSSRRTIRRVDTLRTFAARDSLGEGQYLSGYLEIPIPAGRYEVRAAVSRDSLTGGIGWQRGVVLERSSGLAVSDIVLGREGSGLAWRHGGRSVPLNPLGTFAQGSTAELYYEMTGVEPGREYRTTIELHRGERGDRRTGSTLRFSERAETRAVAVQRSLGLEGVEPGAYRLRITVEEEGSGRRVVREQTVRVVRR